MAPKTGMTSSGWVEARLPVEGGKVREGSLANEGTSLRGMDNNFLFFMGACVLQVTLACESIVLYMCEGKVLMDKCVLAKAKLHLFRQNTYLWNKKQIQS